MPGRLGCAAIVKSSYPSRKVELLYGINGPGP